MEQSPPWETYSLSAGQAVPNHFSDPYSQPEESTSPLHDLFLYDPL